MLNDDPKLPTAPPAAAEHWRVALEFCLDALFIIDEASARLLDVNEAACALTGHTREELLALPATDLLPMNDPGGSSRDQTRSVTWRANLTRTDGQVTSCELRSHYRQINGRASLLVTARDVTREDELLRFRAAADQVLECITLIDSTTGQVVDANQTACTLLGYSREELLKLNVMDLEKPGHDFGRTRQRYDRVIAEHPRTEVIVAPTRLSNGRLMLMEHSLSAMREHGRWLIVVTSRSIEDRMATQASMARFRAALDQVQDSISLVNRATMQFVDVNQITLRRLKLTREQFIQLRPWDITGTTPEEAELLYDRVIANAPKALTEEATRHFGDGSVRVTEIARNAVMIDGQWYIVVITRDITERRASESRIQLLAEAMNLSEGALFLIDYRTRKVFECNDAAPRLVGMSKEQLLRANLWGPASVHATEQEQIEVYDRLIAQSPVAEVIEMPWNVRGAARSDMYAELSRKALQFNGQWIIVTMVRDISARKHAEAQLAQHLEKVVRSNEELERFAYVASHDLSEPLRMVASYTQLLERRLKDKLDDDSREFMGFVIDGAKRMKQLIDDLLAYSRLGRNFKPFRDVDMNLVMKDVLKNLEQLVKDKSAQIICPPLPVVNGDRTSLIQLMQNLVGNALKFVAREAPRVTISCTESETDWTFTVADNGVGIEPKYFERIFVVFQRLHTREEYEGTGIGLAVCKKIVLAHGGRIWVESERGLGSQFHFTLSKTPPPPGE